MIFHYIFLLALFADIQFTSGFVSTAFGLTNLVKPNLATTLYVSTGDAVVIDIANKYFQLEEMEDKDSCITEIFFNPNKTISVGNTDGPIPLSCDGDWELSEDGGFKMTLKRTYSGGQPHTDMGEFTFDVERTYVAQPEKIGNLLGFSGSIHENYHGDAKLWATFLKEGHVQ